MVLNTLKDMVISMDCFYLPNPQSVTIMCPNYLPDWKFYFFVGLITGVAYIIGLVIAQYFNDNKKNINNDNIEDNGDDTL